MEKSSEKDLNRNFIAILLLYMAFFNCNMILSVNIGNLLLYLPETTASGIALLVAFQLLVQIISLLFFGSYVTNITEKYSRKKIFLISNALICIGFFMVAISINFTMFFIFSLIANFSNGAFLPIGFAIIGDSFPPKERGNKFGLMNFALLMGSGGGIIFGGLIGSLGGPIGWRIAYCVAAFLVLTAIIRYSQWGIEVSKGQSEPEFNDLEAANQTYDYKIKFSNFSQILKKKSVIGIYIVVIFTAITTTTMGTWAIYFISMKIDSPFATFIASTLVILTGLGGLFGTIFGGKMGDSLSQKGKVRGRAVLSLF
ncbi:MAG: MFS transporter, partial [Promethearchaeota archaeon]